MYGYSTHFYITHLPRCLWAYGVRNVQNTNRQGCQIMGYSFDKKIEWEYDLSLPFRRRLTADFNFCIDGKKYTIKKRYRTDGASIPQAAWSIIGSPFTGRYVIPALVHDMLYGTNLFTKKRSDEIFYDLMKQCGVGSVKAWTIYQAVNWFGGSSYNRTDEQIKGACEHILVNGKPCGVM